MTEREEIEIEIKSYQEVIIHDCDSRMEFGLNKFLSEIEDKIKELKKKLNGT